MKELDNIKESYISDMANVKIMDDLNNLRVNYLGKNGHLTTIMKLIKDLSVEEKKSFGVAVNDLKGEVTRGIEAKTEELKNAALLAELNSMPKVDLTVSSAEKKGSLHPVTIIQQRLINIFRGMGFAVEDGNEVETEYNNFEAVNIPKFHPARDMQDTFYLDNNQVLKTHTSASQNRIMKKYGAPLKVIFPGRCFRNEELDASHENTFFQMEGMMVDKNVSISNLIYFMKTMLSEVFGKEVDVRLRPGFFPFVEPGFELDCSCPYCGGKGCRVCKQGGWIELCPCGMIHPNVLEMGGINPDEYQGFAFGLGLSRLVMMTYGFTDIRNLNGKDLKVLEQTKIK
ncbi:MAG: phenylalanine--tRNA ligase subunit alpha [Clostridiales bacterium]|nr:phenylalanine--tRNA ligase subunit alpha [Clostridiales bacterium]